MYGWHFAILYAIIYDLSDGGEHLLCEWGLNTSLIIVSLPFVLIKFSREFVVYTEFKRLYFNCFNIVPDADNMVLYV